MNFYLQWVMFRYSFTYILHWLLMAMPCKTLFVPWFRSFLFIFSQMLTLNNSSFSDLWVPHQDFSHPIPLVQPRTSKNVFYKKSRVHVLSNGMFTASSFPLLWQALLFNDLNIGSRDRYITLSSDKTIMKPVGQRKQ